MENAEIVVKIDVISRVNLPFIQEEMTLWLIDNNAKIGFLPDDHDLREIWYRTTESFKFMSFCYDVRSLNFKEVYESKMPSNLFSSKAASSAISKLHSKLA